MTALDLDGLDAQPWEIAAVDQALAEDADAEYEKQQHDGQEDRDD